MYEIRAESLKTFVESRNVQLPRFQRKQTWDYKRNFELCISIFKNYPIGVIILSVDTDRNRTIRWLLDGRQRRNALKQLFDDPEIVYHWAQKFIKFKNNFTHLELQDKFIEKINEFLEAEEEENPQNTEVLTEDDIDETEPSNNGDSNEGLSSIDMQDGLSLLFEIIKVCHSKTKSGTGFTAPFDFVKYTSQANNGKLTYVTNTADGKYKLDSKRLKTFIVNYLNWCNEEGRDYDSESTYINYLEDQCNFNINAAFEQCIRNRWAYIVERIKIVIHIDNMMSAQTIGLIEVKNLKAANSQKIFNLINSQGSPLKAVEILSARPKWNKIIESPSAEVKELVRELYQTQIGITPDTVVRWDLAATLLRRIKPNFIFKNFSTASPDTKEGKADFEKELTTAFKCLSGIYVGGVTKVDIDKLPDANINWETDIDTLVFDIRNFVNILNTFRYFKYFSTWKRSIQELTSDGVAMEFLILAYNEYLKRGKPVGTNTDTKKFQKYCFILWDKLVYEYINLLWKGSSDSKTRNDIQLHNITPIDTDRWLALLEDIYATNKIGNKDLTYSYMQAVLAHFYSLMEISAPTTELDFQFDIDHIIPQTAFKESVLPDKEKLQDNLFNLAFLPKRENITKSNKRLREIYDPWLHTQISAYEFIEPEQYEKFSDVRNYKELFELRKNKFIQAFSEKRDYILNN